MAVTGEMKLDSQKLLDIKEDLAEASELCREMAYESGTEGGGELPLKIMEVSVPHDYYLSSEKIEDVPAEIYTMVRKAIDKLQSKVDYVIGLITQQEAESNRLFEELGERTKMSIEDYEALLDYDPNETFSFFKQDAVIKVNDGKGGYVTYTIKEYREKLEEVINSRISSNGVGSQVVKPYNPYSNTGTNVSNAATATVVPKPSVPSNTQNTNINNNQTDNEQNTIIPPTENVQPDNNNNENQLPNNENKVPVENNDSEINNNNAQTDTKVPDTSTNGNSNTGFGQIFNNNNSNNKPNISTNIIQSNPNTNAETAPSIGTDNLPLDSESQTENIFGDFGNVFENDNVTSPSPIVDENKSKGFNPIPLGVGLGLATAAGIGAKVIHDRKKNNELDEEQLEAFEGNKFWLDDEPSVINSEEDSFANEDFNRFDSGIDSAGYSASYSTNITDSAIPDNTWSIEDDAQDNDQMVDLLNGN